MLYVISKKTMKILVQNYRTGNLEMLEVPMFTTVQGLLVETMASVVSVGTEKPMIDVAKKSLLGKALARPDWVKQVIDKVKTEGVMGILTNPQNLNLASKV